ncbi:MAG: hypothetical protein IIZ17_00080 [Eubacteriaceae bacterium]|nr:hypothetical protein [Eubacteriaceae bacterium]
MKRVSIFSGHYGSGKTNAAINYARLIRSMGHEVIIADLDIVNPYFRTKDSEEMLAREGIEMISLPFANSNVDLPSIPSEAYRLVQDRSRYAVIDLGGDDRGALAMGRFAPYIIEENDYDMFFVVNFYRPLTTTAADAMEVIREIEGSTALRFSGIVNDSNLASETDKETILSTLPLAEELSALSGLPVVFTCVDAAMKDKPDIKDLFELTLQEKYY